VALDPVTVWKGVQFWTTVKPFKKFKAWRARRKGKAMAIDLGTRTTTNMTVSGLVVFGVMKLVSTYFPSAPTEGLEELVAAVVAYIVGYLSKSPTQPKVL
jgi:hypothetical protein